MPMLAVAEERHPLIGEPPPPMHVLRSGTAVAGPAAESFRIARQKEELVGLHVYDADRHRLGDVAAVLFAGNGDVDTLLIRTDGSPAALPFDRATIANGRDGESVIVVDADDGEIAGAALFAGVDEIPPITSHWGMFAFY